MRALKRGTRVLRFEVWFTKDPATARVWFGRYSYGWSINRHVAALVAAHPDAYFHEVAVAHPWDIPEHLREDEPRAPVPSA